MENILRQAQKMQQDIKRAQDELAKRVVEGSAGGGVFLLIVVLFDDLDVETIPQNRSRLLGHLG